MDNHDVHPMASSKFAFAGGLWAGNSKVSKPSGEGGGGRRRRSSLLGNTRRESIGHGASAQDLASPLNPPPKLAVGVGSGLVRQSSHRTGNVSLGEASIGLLRRGSMHRGSISLESGGGLLRRGSVLGSHTDRGEGGGGLLRRGSILGPRRRSILKESHEAEPERTASNPLAKMMMRTPSRIVMDGSEVLGFGSGLRSPGRRRRKSLSAEHPLLSLDEHSPTHHHNHHHHHHDNVLQSPKRTTNAALLQMKLGSVVDLSTSLVGHSAVQHDPRSHNLPRRQSMMHATHEHAPVYVLDTEGPERSASAVVAKAGGLESPPLVIKDREAILRERQSRKQKKKRGKDKEPAQRFRLREAARKVIQSLWASKGTVKVVGNCRFCQGEVLYQQLKGLSHMDMLNGHVTCRFCKHELMVLEAQDLAAGQTKKRRRDGMTEDQYKQRLSEQISVLKEKAAEGWTQEMEERQRQAEEERRREEEARRRREEEEREAAERERRRLELERRQAALKALMNDIESNNKRIFKHHDWHDVAEAAQETSHVLDGPEPTPNTPAALMAASMAAVRWREQALRPRMGVAKRSEEYEHVQPTAETKRDPPPTLDKVRETTEEPTNIRVLSKPTIRRIVNSSSVLQVLTEEEVAWLFRQVGLRKYPAGWVLIKQGEVGSSMFCICEGEVDVYVHQGFMCTILEGQVVGEMSVIHPEHRSASIICGTPVLAVEIPRWALKEVLRDHMEVWEELKLVAASRKAEMRRVLELQSSATTTDNLPPPLQTKQYVGNFSPSDVVPSPSNRRRETLEERTHPLRLEDVPEPTTEPVVTDAAEHGDVERLLDKSEIARALSSEERARLLAESKFLSCPVGHRLMRQGEDGNSMFIMVEGELDVFIDGRMAATHSGEGKIIGEMSVIYSEPRTASVVCGTPCTVIEVTSAALRRALQGHSRVWQHLFAVAEKREIQRAVVSRMHQLGAAVAIAKIDRIKRKRTGDKGGGEGKRVAGTPPKAESKPDVSQEGGKQQERPLMAWYGKKKEVKVEIPEPAVEAESGTNEETEEDVQAGEEEGENQPLEVEQPEHEIGSPNSSEPEEEREEEEQLREEPEGEFMSEEKEGDDSGEHAAEETAEEANEEEKEEKPSLSQEDSWESLEYGVEEGEQPSALSRISSGGESGEGEVEEAERMAKEATAVMELLGDEDAMMAMYGEEGDQVLTEILAESPPQFIDIAAGDDLESIHKAMDRVKAGSFDSTVFVSGPWPPADSDSDIPTPQRILELRRVRPRDAHRIQIEVERHLQRAELRPEEQIARRLRQQQHLMTVPRRMDAERERMQSRVSQRPTLPPAMESSEESSEEEQEGAGRSGELWLDEEVLRGHIEGQAAALEGGRQRANEQHLRKLYPGDWTRVHHWLAGTWEAIAALQARSIQPPWPDPDRGRAGRHRVRKRGVQRSGNDGPDNRVSTAPSVPQGRRTPGATIRSVVGMGSFDDSDEELVVLPAPSPWPNTVHHKTPASIVATRAGRSPPLGQTKGAQSSKKGSRSSKRMTTSSTSALEGEEKPVESREGEPGATQAADSQDAPGEAPETDQEVRGEQSRDSVGPAASDHALETASKSESVGEDRGIGEIEAVGQSLLPSPVAPIVKPPPPPVLSSETQGGPEQSEQRPTRSAGADSNASSRLLGVTWPDDPRTDLQSASGSGKLTPSVKSAGSSRQSRTPGSGLPSVRGHSSLKATRQGTARSVGSQSSRGGNRAAEQGLSGVEPQAAGVDGPWGVFGPEEDDEEEQEEDHGSTSLEVPPVIQEPSGIDDKGGGAEEDTSTEKTPQRSPEQATAKAKAKARTAESHARGLLETLEDLRKNPPPPSTTAEPPAAGITALGSTAGVTTFRVQQPWGQQAWGLIGIGPLVPSSVRHGAPSTRGTLKQRSASQKAALTQSLPSLHVKFDDQKRAPGLRRSASVLGAAGVEPRVRDPARHLGRRNTPTPGERGPTPLLGSALHRYQALSRGGTAVGEGGERGPHERDSSPPPGVWGRSQSPVPEGAAPSGFQSRSGHAHGHGLAHGGGGRSHTSLGIAGEVEALDSGHSLALRWVSLPIATVKTTTATLMPVSRKRR